MSKKELIINGVDVSGCIYLWGYDECIVQNEHCKKFEYCHYKQLQRVKFENENNKEMVASAENLINENAFLLGELEQLKKDNEFADTILQRKFDKLKNKLQIATEMLEKILLDVRFADVEIHAQQALEQIGAEE